MKRNIAVLVTVAVAVAVMLWFGVRQARPGGGSPLAGGGGSIRGKAAPDFKLVDIRTGKSVQLSDFQGKAVLLNFWATWCPPCKVEIPWFVDLQKQYGPQGLQVIGVAMDDAGKDAIEKFADDMGINYLILQGTEKVADEYGGVEALPTTFYIGRDGRITKRVFGLASHGEVEQNIKLALNSTAPRANTAGAAIPPGEQTASAHVASPGSQ